MLKTCTKCGETKELEEFVGEKTCKNGRAGCCLECKRGLNKRYNLKNKEKRAEKSREYQAKNKEKIAKKHREYRSKNKEQQAEKCREYQAKNKEKIKNRLGNVRLKLLDTYVKNKIMDSHSIQRKDITLEMIELKRELILMHRQIKGVRDELNSAGN